ncbi:VOC family protein [Streptomyces sp. NPDC001941]|uniref:VOC family protein n=1 Tax=Streptomyces sp. NPDC001941 TaxID=3154659 RepID=UPI00332274DB
MTDESPRFDHLLHCVPDLDAAVQAYREAGLTASPHRQLPVAKAHFGAPFVEIVTVENRPDFLGTDRGRAFAERGWLPYADELAANGGGALTFALRVPDAEAAGARLSADGHRVRTGEFTPGGFREAVLLDVPQWAPYFVTYVRADERTGDGAGHAVAGLVVETPRPAAAAVWLGEVAGVAADPAGPVVRLPGADVHFTPGPSDAITTLLLTGAAAPTTEVEGLALRPAR